jgi:thioredoxin reductase (NADPH)
MQTLKLYGTNWCDNSKAIQALLDKYAIDYDYVDVDVNEEATATLDALQGGERMLPTLVINGQQINNPSIEQTKAALGINNNQRIVLYGADWCPDCQRSKGFLRDNNFNFQYINIDEQEWSIPFVEKINNGKRKIPTILIGEDVFVEPSNAELRKQLNVEAEDTSHVYDTIIVGGGAAGLTASIYAQRDRFESIILEKSTLGGNAFITEKIENYPGFQSISGPDLMKRMEEQTRTYGTAISTGVRVLDIQKERGVFKILTDDLTYFGRSVVLATGSTYRRLKIPGERELIGSSVHFCATCDGAFYREREVIVIGGGNSALEEAIFLAGFTKKVTIINLNDHFTASQTYIDKLPDVSNIEVKYGRESVEFHRNEDGQFTGLEVKDVQSGQTEIVKADGVFVFIGLVPNTKDFKGIIDLDERGFIKTSGLGQTSVPGIFAAGDNRQGAIAQVAAATGEGVLASYGLREYLSKIG